MLKIIQPCSCDILLAKLLTKKITNQEYYSFNNISASALENFCFESEKYIVDFRFEEKIHNLEKYEVKRIYYDFTGCISRTEIVSLEPAEFWKRVQLLRRYYEKFNHFPFIPTSINMFRNVNRKKRITL